jgi:ATP-dependent DNA ligase
MPPTDQSRLTGRLPAGLAGPVEVELARAVEHIPTSNALSGGTVWEPKLDGYRGVIVLGEQTRIWSRNRRDLTGRFPASPEPPNSSCPPARWSTASW